MKGWGWLALLLGALLGSAWARRSQDLHCGACRALVDELEWEIAQVDPKKTIQMGSFRINPDGSQSVVEVPYARSEAHLTELLEEVCDRMKEYGEQIDLSTHRKNYVRVVGRNGESSELDLQGIRIDSDISGTLKFACESIVEEYEDELIEFFSREADNVKDKLCSKRTGKLSPFISCSHSLVEPGTFPIPLPSHLLMLAPELASISLGLDIWVSILFLSALRICGSLT
uniref:Saposin B-type domain-containing protein n=1 Tax=Castor canadensis TaxID=51338 RepID=A0A8C0X5U6_CASCN